MAIKEIKSLDECKFLTYDSDSYGSTPTHYATDYVLEQNKDIMGKKMLITITDGIPEVWQKHRQYNDPKINEKTKQSYVKAENMGFNIFGISIDIREDHKENFKKIFRQKYVNIVDLEQMKTRMVRKIEEFTRTLE
jgi:Mg-chelatase subunit ChlD